MSSRPILVTADRGYRLELGNARLDADEFEEQYRIGSETLQRNATLASTELAKALDPWRGSALEEFRYEQFAQAEIFRLEGLRTACPRFVDPRETTPTRKYAPYVLTSMLKDYDIAVYEAIRSSTEGTSGSSMLFDLANEGIGYSDYTAAIRDVAPVMDAAAQEIMDGTIEVVEWSPIPPAVAWRYEPDVVFDVASAKPDAHSHPLRPALLRARSSH